MASGIIQATVVPPVPPPPPGSAEHERVIQRQLGRTSLHVRLVDLAFSVAVWIVGVLAVLLVAALVDHWIVGLGTIGRGLVLLGLIAGSVWYFVARMLPLLIRGINPTYAARTIEEATPSLKNSLINFLLLRQDHSGVREVVFQAVEQKAAADIAAVPVEATVDRSRLIRAGYVLCGVMALFAAYKILSPKDPFQTVARVIAPWADIARPSRVEITDVLPGNSEVYHGQVVTVSAIVSGVREGDPVTLLFSTEDGQTVNRAVPMAVDSGGLRYQCTLPPADENALSAQTSGLQQDVTYRIVAGDAETSEYKLSVVAAPTIIVDRLEYQFPPYTKKAAETVPQQGDIKALEGTRVTIHAVANQPIKSAWQELDPGVKDVPPEVMQLATEGSRAWGTVVLQLKADRKTAWHQAYQVRFFNERGQRSQQPIVHKIEVIRDLPPEVQILQPQRLKIEVPEDGEQAIEVRGLDPDYGLSRLRVEGRAGQKAMEADLLDPMAGQPPQMTGAYVFKPSEHGLKAGDELRYVGVAEDNRTSPLTGKPEPNVARTAEYTIVVIPPRQAEQANNPNQKPMPGQEDKPDGGAGEKPPMPMPAGDKPDMNPPKQGEQEKQENMPPKQGEQNAQKPMQSEKQQGEKQQGEKQQGDQGGQGDKQQGQPQQGGQPDKSQGEGGQPQQGDSQGSQTGGSPQQGQPMNDAGQSAKSEPGSAGGKSAGTGQQPSGQQGDPSADASGQPNSAGGPNGKAHDGQAFEEVLKDIQQNSQGQPNPSGQPQLGSSNQTDAASESPMPRAGQEENQRGQNPAGQQPQGKPMAGDAGAKAQGAKGQGEKGQGQKPQGQDPQGQKPDGQNLTEGTPQPGDRPQPGDAPQNPAQSGTKNEGTEPGVKPAANDQQGKPDGQGDAAQGEKADPQDRLPGDKQGQDPSQQKSAGNKGGSAQGADKTDQGQKSKAGQGEKKDPGAADPGDEGAGNNSTDKTGSGQGQDENRDKNKTQQPDSSQAQESEPSPPGNSKRQSDSKGGQSGDQTGGGSKGGGQSAGQEGNDSAGSKSAADQGAGAANETGSGETGSKAGTQQEAGGKTGQSGDKSGVGSGSKTGDMSKTGGNNQPGNGSSAGPVVGGGGDGNREKLEPGQQPEAEAGDAANLEYARKATEMVLQRLKDQEHNPDPELLDKLGWSREDLAEFLRRWESLQQSAEKTPEGQRELDEALRSLGLRDPANRKRAGGATSDAQRDLRDSGGRSSPPAKYRDLFDAFRKGAARSSE